MINIVLNCKCINGAVDVMKKFENNKNFNDKSEIIFEPEHWVITKRNTMVKKRKKIITSIILD